MSGRKDMGDASASAPARAAGPSDPSPQAVSAKGSIPIAGHTPGPWALFNQNHVLEIHDSPDISVARAVVHWSGFDAAQGDFAERAANATFIVRACNAHYELVEALEQFVREEEAGGWESARLDRARAALAKAGAA